VSASAGIFHFPEIGIEAMRAGMSAHYQLWLACRLLDDDGRGWLAVDAVKTALTQDGALFLYKAARLRNLLKEGNGRFWAFSDGRVWMKRPSQLAGVLGLTRITGRSVEMTHKRLVQKAGYFRAAIFSDWLVRGAGRTRPLSQSMIESMTGIQPRTQRRYLRRAGVKVKHNIAIGDKLSDGAYKQAEREQHGVFVFTDFHGKRGEKFGRYVAWHLPASYEFEVKRGSAASRRNCNKGLLGLSHGETGNGRSGRLFFDDGGSAAQAIADREKSVHVQSSLDDVLDAARPVYWRVARAKTGTGLWHVMRPSLTV